VAIAIGTSSLGFFLGLACKRFAATSTNRGQEKERTKSKSDKRFRTGPLYHKKKHVKMPSLLLQKYELMWPADIGHSKKKEP
jgi:hypothetical protein